MEVIKQVFKATPSAKSLDVDETLARLTLPEKVGLLPTTTVRSGLIQTLSDIPPFCARLLALERSPGRSLSGESRLRLLRPPARSANSS